MPVYIAGKIKRAFNEGQGHQSNVGNIIFTFTTECLKFNLALPPHHIIIQECNLPMYNKAESGTREIQMLVTMSLIGNFGFWEEFGMFNIEG